MKRVRNWRQYNKKLIAQGSIELWINEEAVKHWQAQQRKRQGRGRPRIYSDVAIETCVMLKVLFQLTYRRCQGFVTSLFHLMKLEVKMLHYSQICRRQKELKLSLRHEVQGKIHVVVDGTGLKIFGEGEWKVRQHGYSKHRMWRKLHIGLDVDSQEIVMMELTENNIGENALLKPLLDQYVTGELGCVGGDKGYDSYACHEEIGNRGAQSAIEPQRKAKVRNRKHRGKQLVRDEIVRRIRAIGREQWKKEVSYHRRSLVETAFFRYKTLFGSRLRSRLLENQKIEAMVGCNILNCFIKLGASTAVGA